jgi:anti-sigma regulatory factor (Ser/Thr protein kinase)
MGVKTVSFQVPGGRAAASAARQSARSAGADMSREQGDRLALLVSELVNNAVQHGGARDGKAVEVRLTSLEDRLRVEVEDPGPNGSGPAERVTAEGGWGLVLVDGLADRWGLESVPAGGSVAWFELSIGTVRHRAA